jgi:hypothetical protein
MRLSLLTMSFFGDLVFSAKVLPPYQCFPVQFCHCLIRQNLTSG